jgi:hypothetical protein
VGGLGIYVAAVHLQGVLFVCLYRSASSDCWLLHWQTLGFGPACSWSVHLPAWMYIHSIDAVRISALF